MGGAGTPNQAVQATAGSLAVGWSVSCSCFGVFAPCLTLVVLRHVVRCEHPVVLPSESLIVGPTRPEGCGVLAEFGLTLFPGRRRTRRWRGRRASRSVSSFWHVDSHGFFAPPLTLALGDMRPSAIVPSAQMTFTQSLVFNTQDGNASTHPSRRHDSAISRPERPTKRVEPTAGSLVFEWSSGIVTSLVFSAVAHPPRYA